jgi:hypothetical protein
MLQAVIKKTRRARTSKRDVAMYSQNLVLSQMLRINKLTFSPARILGASLFQASCAAERKLRIRGHTRARVCISSINTTT